MVQYVQRRESKKAAARNMGTAESHDENSRTKGRKLSRKAHTQTRQDLK